MYELEQAWEAATPDGEGFYVLRGGTNWASVEGHASEWLAIADAIRRRVYLGFRRCAVSPTADGGARFWSPRNAASPHDTVEMDRADADRFAATILDALRAAGEACVVTPPEAYHGA